MGKLRIGVLFGGKSAEHEVSLESAKTVIATLAKAGFSPLPVYIDPGGAWHLADARAFLAGRRPSGPAVTIDPSTGRLFSGGRSFRADCFFPIIHGTTGEDGVLQGLLEACGVPYVGCGVAASAAGMDKALSKKLAAGRGVPVLPHALADRHEKGSTGRALKEAAGLPLPLFVKPVSLGSSVGVTKVKKLSELEPAFRKALRYDTRAMAEVGVDRAREIVVGVLGSESKASASVPGEVRPKGGHEFFDYEAKYLDDNGMDFLLPAPLKASTAARLRAYAVEVFRALGCSGLARIDFFVDPRDESRAWFCEINTVPGFTSHSLYPRLWGATGVPIERLVTRLVGLGMERAADRAALKTTRL